MQHSGPPDRTHTDRDSINAAAQPLRVVVVTTGSAARLHTLRALARRNIELAGILVEARVQVRDCFRTSRRIERILETPVAIARSLRRRARLRWYLREVAARGAAVVVVPDRRTPDALRQLIALRADIVVLAGVGLVTTEMLAIARLGTLNAHPALLPWARGNGVVLHSIQRGVAVGAACHRVDSGIDTGPVIRQRLLPVRGDETLETLELRALDLAGQVLAEVVVEALANGSLPAGEPQRERFPLCRWADQATRVEVARKVATGLASELFRRWSGCCIGGGLDVSAQLPTTSVPPLTMPVPNSSSHEREAAIHGRR